MHLNFYEHQYTHGFSASINNQFISVPLLRNQLLKKKKTKEIPTNAVLTSKRERVKTLKTRFYIPTHCTFRKLKSPGEKHTKSCTKNQIFLQSCKNQLPPSGEEIPHEIRLRRMEPEPAKARKAAVVAGARPRAQSPREVVTVADARRQTRTAKCLAMFVRGVKIF